MPVPVPNFLREHPRLALGWMLVALLAAVTTTSLAVDLRRTRAAQRQAARCVEQLRALDSGALAATVENAEAIEADAAWLRAALAQEVAAWRAANEQAWGGDTAAADRAEAYFELAAFRERMRRTAAECGVDVHAVGHFGFPEYAQTAPEEERRGLVSRERRRLEHLLAAVWAARPRELAAVARSSGGEQVQLPAGASVRSPGLIDTSAFKVDLVGTTATLRDVMVALSASSGLVLVRAVEVERLQAPEEATDPATSIRRSGAAAVESGHSRFRLVVEFADMIGEGREES